MVACSYRIDDSDFAPLGLGTFGLTIITINCNP